MLHVVKLPLLDLYTPAGDGNWAALEKSAGRRGGQREAGKKEVVHGSGWMGGRASGRRLCGVSLGPLSSYPVMLCSVGQVLSSYASHQRIR